MTPAYGLGRGVPFGKIAGVMLPLSMLLSLALQVAPGLSFSTPSEGTVLRAGPGQDFPGVMTLDGQTVVRLGAQRGAYREVFVAGGYPVYLHGDYVRTVPQEAQAFVKGDRVNVRLLPAVEGNRPLGQLSAGSGPLVLLESEEDWVRVIAPIVLPLFAQTEAVPPTEAEDAEARWHQARARRERRRQEQLAAWRAASPAWQAEQGWHGEVQRLSTLDLSQQTDEDLSAYLETLDEIRTQAGWDDTRALAEQVRSRIEQVRTLRGEVERALRDIRRKEDLEAAAIARESRILGLGLRFAGRGTGVELKGRVIRKLGEDETVVYLLAPEDGAPLKLTAAATVAQLDQLVGKEVLASGRRLFLATVRGPVLVLDRVHAATP